jgi:hypothetical protein
MEHHCSARKKRKEWVEIPGLSWQYTGDSASPIGKSGRKKLVLLTVLVTAAKILNRFVK